MDGITRVYRQYPGMRAFAARGSIISSNDGGTRSVNLDISGNDLATLYEVAQTAYRRAEEVFEEILDIADDGTNDWMERNGKDGETGDTVLNGEHVQRSRLRIDARKWALSKMIPKKYGDKIDTSGNHTFNVTIDKDDAGL